MTRALEGKGVGLRRRGLLQIAGYHIMFKESPFLFEEQAHGFMFEVHKLNSVL